MRGRFFWRIGIFAALMFFLLVGACTLLIWFVATQAGVISLSSGPFHLSPVFGVVLFAIIVATLAFAGRTLRRATIPIGDVMQAANRIADGDYSARVSERGPPQVRTLARAFNAMSARLQSSDEQRRHLLTDVTHELRTPLTVIQGNLEGLVDGVYPRDDAHLAPILEETRLLSRLIDDLRTLALAESGALTLKKEQIDLAALASEIAASFRAQADPLSVNLITEGDPGLMVHADPARIRELLENLIANALRYTPREGTIRLSCAKAGEHAVIAVSDTGAGIPPEDLPRVFNRFYKSRDSRGSGLGLAIAKNLVAVHGGEINATAKSEMGQPSSLHCPSLRGGD